MLGRKLRKLKEKLFDGDLTISKVDFWLAALVCLLGGIVFGLRKAPWTHGVTIGSNNGNNYGIGASVEENAEEGTINKREETIDDKEDAAIDAADKEDSK